MGVVLIRKSEVFTGKEAEGGRRGINSSKGREFVSIISQLGMKAIQIVGLVRRV
jgi:hypothetical protein